MNRMKDPVSWARGETWLEKMVGSVTKKSSARALLGANVPGIGANVPGTFGANVPGIGISERAGDRYYP